nr:S-phase kinase-associated protein 1-like [Aedes albopictus]
MPSKTIPTIKLQSEDGEQFEVPPPSIKCFKTIQSIVEDPLRSESKEAVFRVPNVNGGTLQILLEWADYHKDDESLDGSNGHILTMCEWDRELLKVDMNVLHELVLAASCLHIQGLLDVACLAYMDLPKNEAPRYVTVDNADDEFIAQQQLIEYVYESSGYDSDDSDLSSDSYTNSDDSGEK